MKTRKLFPLVALLAGLTALPLVACGDSVSDSEDIELRTQTVNGDELVLSEIVQEPEVVRLQAELVGGEAVQLELSPSLLRATTATHELVVWVEDEQLSGYWAELAAESRGSGEFQMPLAPLQGVLSRHSSEDLMTLIRDGVEAEPGLAKSASLDALLPVVVAAGTHVESELGISVPAMHYVVAKLALHTKVVSKSDVPCANEVANGQEAEAVDCNNGCTCSGSGSCGACCDDDQTPSCGYVGGYCSCTCNNGGGVDCDGLEDCLDNNY